VRGLKSLLHGVGLAVRERGQVGGAPQPGGEATIRSAS
jgi:hypothetical protein